MDAEVQVLGLLRAKLLDPRTIATLLPRFVERMRPDIATDLDRDRLVRLGFAVAGVDVTPVHIDSIDDSMNLSAAAVPGVNAHGYLYAASYDVLDPASVCRKLAKFGAHGCTDGLPMPRPPKSVAIAVYGSDALVHRLHLNGYTNTTRAGGATGAATIVYPPGEAADAWAIARLLTGGGAQVEPGSAALERIVVRE
jgi:hypothetical protein